MTPEDRFVKAATRGLSRGKRAEAQAELRSHLHERTQQLILAGKPLPSAQAQAMQELGAPAQIARGLRRTHHLPDVVGTLALMTMAGTVFITALTIAYAHGVPSVTRMIDPLLQSAGVADPCRQRTACVTLYSDQPITRDDLLQNGLVTWNEAAAYLADSGVKVQGIFQKSVTLPGFANLKGAPLTVQVGWDRHPGLRGNVLDLGALFVEAAAQGWPVALRGQGDELELTVSSRTIGTTDHLAHSAVRAYLNREFGAGLADAVRQAAQKQLREPFGPPTTLRPYSVAFPFIPAATTPTSLHLPTLDAARLYALVKFVPRITHAGATWEPNLSATLVTSWENELRLYGSGAFEGLTQLTLVPSADRFLNKVRAGQATAMLVEVPRDLKPTPSFQAVALPEQTVSVN